jgi:cellulose synthase/poly-beta-1,6-N-acetylglucosamine synthase-like glycosyltransferase
LRAQDHPPYEVIVVVRDDDPDTRALLAETATDGFELKAIVVDVPGVVAALNAGLDAAVGEIIAITDDDTVPRPDWLRRLETHFRSAHDVGGVGGRDWISDEAGVLDGGKSTVGRVRWYGRLVGNHHLGVGGARDVDVLKGANMSYRRSAIKGIGFDTHVRGAGAQVHFEVALGLAVKRAGWRLIYDPEVAVDHYPAERFQDEQRGQPSLAGLQNAVHNETYALLRWLPWWRKALAFAYGMGVGTRLAPGLIVALERWFREPDRERIKKRFIVSTRGRLDGYRTFRVAGR